MYEHNALGYWSGLALCLTKSEAVEHAVLRQLLLLLCAKMLDGWVLLYFMGILPSIGMP